MANILERNIKTKIIKKEKEDFAENALYREVWEDVNNEKTILFLKRYYKYILVLVSILLIGIISIQSLHYYKLRQLNRIATIYENAILKGDLETLANITKNKNSISDIASFQSILIEKNKEKIVIDLEKIAKNGNSRDYKDLAKSYIAYIKGDSITGKELEKFLSSIITKKSPYYYSAMLLIAQKYAYENNDKKKNFYLDKILNDKNTPAIISANIEILK